MYDKYLKRVLDIVIIIISILPLLIVSILISIAIKLDSKGPVIFKQKRLGRNGRVFDIYKFRTMVDNAENIGTGINTYEGDPRITRVGNILRKTSLDEMPQLMNVLKGDMSLVGPRPPVPHHPRNYNEYSDNQIKRFNVRPGITGYAQVKGRNLLSWDERIKVDVQYVQKQSLLLDIKILFMTIVKVFQKEGVHSSGKEQTEKNETK